MQTYDFIVVGSGSAGSVVAERLSASGRFSVLVLEAGGSDRRFFVQMPLGYGKTFFDPAVNWNYRTEPDPGPCRQCRPLAARQGARRLQLDQRHGLDPGPPRATMMPGRRPAIRAGALTTCCRPSRRSRTTRPARTNGAAPADRCMSPTASRCRSSADPALSRRPAQQAGLPLNPRLQRRARRKASASTRSRPRAAAACRRRAPSCARR